MLQRFISDMDLASNNVALRPVYAKHLLDLLERVGVRAVRQIAGFTRVLDAYLQIYEAPGEMTRVHTLDALFVFMPVIENQFHN